MVFMKGRITKRNAVVLTVFLFMAILCVSGCGRYRSRYKAVGLVTTASTMNGFINFYSFDGTRVFKLSNKKGTEGQLIYSARLEEGSAAVFYDIGGEKAELFTIHGGEETDDVFTLPGSGTVYVIIETEGKCQNGEFRFEIR